MLTMRGGSQVGNNGVKMARPPPVPPRPDRSLVADALAKSRKVPAPVLPPGLKKDQPVKTLDVPASQSDSKPTNKLPSPKLNGLSRVKSFIRDVMNEKKHSDDKKNKDKDEHLKNVKSQIPIPQPQSPLKNKDIDPLSMNHPQEESVKNQSSQSVVRSLYSVLTNSDKDKNSVNDSKSTERIRVVKSNSFAEKAVPVRRAPPPPISPKPTKKQIEDKIGRIQNTVENFSVRKLSVSCEELNNASSRPVVYQSAISKLTSPIFGRKIIPPSLPSGKPPLFAKKKSLSSSPTESGSIAVSAFAFCEKSNSAEKVFVPDEISRDAQSSLKFCDKENERFTEKLISEIISAKNDALLLNYNNTNGETEKKIENQEITNNTLNNICHTELNTTEKNDFNSNDKKNSINDNLVKCVNISYNGNIGLRDNISTCGSDSGSSGGGKTVLFINSEISHAPNPVENSVQTEKIEDVDNFRKNRFNDIANHELLIAELQDMRREAFEDHANKIQRQSSREHSPSSLDSVSTEPQNIQHSDWVQVQDDGQRIRYSSCQIVIEDPSSPVNDSGICLDDNFYSDSSYSLSPSLVSRLKEQYYANLKMSSLQGLPPLPKSLSGFNVNAESGPPQSQPPPPPVPARSAASLRYGAQNVRPGSSEPPAQNGTTEPPRQQRKPTTLDTQLAVLKREMLSLRQLDLSLLSQLWSLNESIHEFRQYMGGPGGGGVGVGGVGEGDLEDDGDDSSSGGEDPRPPPQRGRTPI